MRKLRPNEIRRDLTEVRDWMNHLIEDCDRICRYANDFMDDGVSGVSYEGRRKGSDVSDPVGGRAEARERDRVEKSAVRFWKQLVLLKKDARHLSGIGWSLLPMDAEQARVLAEADEVAHKPDQQTYQAQCKNPHCGRLVARTAKDPLRGGRCDACRKYLDRNGIERPKALCAILENAAEALALDENVVVEGAA